MVFLTLEINTKPRGKQHGATRFARKNTKLSPCLTASNDATTPFSHMRFFWLLSSNRFLFCTKDTGDKKWQQH